MCIYTHMLTHVCVDAAYSSYTYARPHAPVPVETHAHTHTYTNGYTQKHRHARKKRVTSY